MTGSGSGEAAKRLIGQEFHGLGGPESIRLFVATPAVPLKISTTRGDIAAAETLSPMPHFGLEAALLSEPVAIRRRPAAPCGLPHVSHLPKCRRRPPHGAAGLLYEVAGTVAAAGRDAVGDNRDSLATNAGLAALETRMLEGPNALRWRILGIVVAANAPMLAAVKPIPSSRPPAVGRWRATRALTVPRQPFPLFMERSGVALGVRVARFEPLRRNSDHYNQRCPGIGPSLRCGFNEPDSRVRYGLIVGDSRDKASPAELRRAATVAAATRHPAPTGEWTWPTT